MPDTLQFETPPARSANTTLPRHDVEHVGGSGIYPASGPLPAGPAELRGQGELGHPEEQRRTRLLTGSGVGTLPLLVGRAVFGGFFLYNGINHFRNRQMMTEYARSKKVPAAGLAVIASGAMIAAGGLSLVAGLRPKVGASLISGFLLGVSPIMHAFWQHEDPQQKMNEMIHFSKNMAMLGGAMLAAAVPEPWSVALNV
jgi:putative oxidoreductase